MLRLIDFDYALHFQFAIHKCLYIYIYLQCDLNMAPHQTKFTFFKVIF